MYSTVRKINPHHASTVHNTRHLYAIPDKKYCLKQYQTLEFGAHEKQLELKGRYNISQMEET